MAEERNETISEFWSLSEMDQAFALATRRTKSTIAAYEHYLMEKKQPKRGGPKNRP